MAISFNNGTNPAEVKFNGQDVTAINFNGQQVWTKASDWQTVWTGSQTFTSPGSFTVPGLTTGGNVQVTATATFEQYVYDFYDNQEYNDTFTSSITRQVLPISIVSNGASVNLTRSGNQISFSFTPYEDYTKAYYFKQTPVSITITEVRRQA